MADLKSLGKLEMGALIAGALTFLLSLFPYYLRFSFDGDESLKELGVSFDTSYGVNAWTSFATLGMLLILVAIGVVAAGAFAKDSLPSGVPWNLIALATAGLGTFLLILRALTSNIGISWSGWLIFITSITLTVFTALAFKESGEEVPWKNEKPAV